MALSWPELTELVLADAEVQNWHVVHRRPPSNCPQAGRGTTRTAGSCVCLLSRAQCRSMLFPSARFPVLGLLQLSFPYADHSRRMQRAHSCLDVGVTSNRQVIPLPLGSHRITHQRNTTDLLEQLFLEKTSHNNQAASIFTQQNTVQVFEAE